MYILPTWLDLKILFEIWKFKTIHNIRKSHSTEEQTALVEPL